LRDRAYLGALVVSEAPELELAPPLEDVSLDDDDGLAPEEAPAPAEPLGLLLLELGLDDEDEDAPPLACSFFCVSAELDEELEPEGGVDGEAPPPEDEDAEPDGLGVVAPPLADDEDEPEGEVVEPEGAVEDDEELRSAPRSHEASSAAPNAMETATAIVESLMWPPWLGYWSEGARIGPTLLQSYPNLVLDGGSCIAARRPAAVAALLEIAMLIGMLRIDLPLHRVRAILLLARCRISCIRRCRGRAGTSLWS
jgi:hypothetical protein